MTNDRLVPRRLSPQEADQMQRYLQEHGVPVAEFPCPVCGRTLGEHSDSNVDHCYPEDIHNG